MGKSWQWKMDDPLVIVDTAIELHTKMIKQMKGVPGEVYCFRFLNFFGVISFVGSWSFAGQVYVAYIDVLMNKPLYSL